MWEYKSRSHFPGAAYNDFDDSDCSILDTFVTLNRLLKFHAVASMSDYTLIRGGRVIDPDTHPMMRCATSGLQMVVSWQNPTQEQSHNAPLMLLVILSWRWDRYALAHRRK